jgi:hypothetical protein
MEPIEPTVSDANEEYGDFSEHEVTETTRKESTFENRLVQQDTKKVYLWMAAVLGMLSVTAALVITLTYRFLTKFEEEEFETAVSPRPLTTIRWTVRAQTHFSCSVPLSQFAQQASVIVASLTLNAATVTSSLEAISDSITSFQGSRSVNDWPLVVVPDFERRGRRAREEAYVDLVGFSPIVTYDDLSDWANFTLKSDSYVSQGFDAEHNTIYHINEEGSEVASKELYAAPFWQSSPPPTSGNALNFNLLSSEVYQFLFGAMTETKSTALSAVYRDAFVHSQYQSSNSSEAPQEALSPRSIVMTPVYDTFDHSSRLLVGILHGVLSWSSYLTDLLPPGTPSIDALLTNSCGQQYSFTITGPSATYVGAGDHHGTKFKQQAVEAKFGERFVGKGTKTYSQCYYSLVIFPSQDFREEYESRDTQRFTLLLVVVFGITAMVFFIFVRFVSSRQTKVMAIANRTTAIVSSLFPDNVRDRLLKEAHDQANKHVEGGNHDDDGDAVLRNILQGETTEQSTRPIADLYPNATVSK